MFYIERISRKDGTASAAMRGRTYTERKVAEQTMKQVAAMNPSYYYRVKEGTPQR